MPEIPKNGNELVQLGNGTQLTFKQLQDIYNELTGKNESISFDSDRPFVLNFSDLEQLHSLIEQAGDSYGVRIKNESISVFHANDQKTVFSSFDRFRAYNVGNTSPIENIHLKYSLMIQVPGTSGPKQYTISINVTSVAALIAKKPELAVGPINLINYVSSKTVRCKIEYVDYVAAKHYQTIILEWINGLHAAPKVPALQKIQSYSHWLRPTFSFAGATGALVALLALNDWEAMIDNPSSDAKFLLGAAVLVFCSKFAGIDAVQICGEYLMSFLGLR